MSKKGGCGGWRHDYQPSECCQSQVAVSSIFLRCVKTEKGRPEGQPRVGHRKEAAAYQPRPDSPKRRQYQAAGGPSSAYGARRVGGQPYRSISASAFSAHLQGSLHGHGPVFGQIGSGGGFWAARITFALMRRPLRRLVVAERVAGQIAQVRDALDLVQQGFSDPFEALAIPIQIGARGQLLAHQVRVPGEDENAGEDCIGSALKLEYPLL